VDSNTSEHRGTTYSRTRFGWFVAFVFLVCPSNGFAGLGGVVVEDVRSAPVAVRNVRLTRHILTVSTACRISETKIVCQQIRYSLRAPKRAARSSIRPSLSRNQFTSELLHRCGVKMEN
jgi:hypothetical protein